MNPPAPQADPARPRLSARGIGHRIGERKLLHGLDLDVTVGTSLAVVGPSGTGKSTLLAILGGLLAPAEGRVTIDHGHGRSVADSVSWVLQTVNVLPDRTVLDNVALGALADGADWNRARELARPALERVGLATFADRPVRALSGGEVQRTVIARALVSTRPFVLADEPTGQLDAATTTRVMDSLLATTATRGLVVVTHDPTVAHRCTRTVRLTDGRLTHL
ncbi:ABC transporter ATP-binding protein [Kitasatospora phosalacinea]|uniref:ABC transporter ATP-binding protein n=1 Tax=Kitasatospora phosalacinea TaxID=2065 RepID=A0ABW6GLA5_9ACTN